MLNSKLHEALLKAFGSVVVENEGVQADIEMDYSSIYGTAWRVADGGEHGEQYRVNCPYCMSREGEPDRNHHLYISYLSYARPVLNGVKLMQGQLMAHCFRRDCMSDKGNREDLARRIGYGMSLAGCDQDGMDVELGVQTADESPYTVSDDMSLEGLRTWVPDFHFCDEGDMDSDIEEYLFDKRGLDMPTVCRFRLGWGKVKTPRTGKLLGNGVPWVITPVVMNGRLKGVQARCPDKFLLEDSIRYWTHPGMRKRAILYNIDSARDIGMGVLCEGAFDVFKVGAPGICGFGHVLSQVQRSLLQGIENTLVLLPDTDPHSDFDTVDEARELAAGLNASEAYPLGAHVVVLPAKDAGEMDRQGIWTTIIRQVPSKVQDYILDKVVQKL